VHFLYVETSTTKAAEILLWTPHIKAKKVTKRIFEILSGRLIYGIGYLQLFQSLKNYLDLHLNLRL